MTALTPCWCCGEERAESELVRLGCHDEVALCDGCVGWLGDQRAQRGAVGVRRAIPILLTTDLRRALEHYEALGFATEAWEGGGYGFLNCGDVELHLGEVDARDPATNPPAR
jgi:hypothetical protein